MLSLQLLKEWDGSMPTSALLEPKYDGIRAVFVVPTSGPIQVFSRTGKPLYNVDNIKKELSGLAGYVIDGEIIVGSPVAKDVFAKTMSLVRAKKAKPNIATFYAFDLLPLSEFKAKKCSLALADRRADLVASIGGKHVKVTPAFVVVTPEDVQRKVLQLLKQGFEGGVLKDLDSVYSYKRSRTWSKIKAELTGDYPIVGFQRGTGKYSKALGALLVKGPKGYVSGVGTGFSDAQRRKIWLQKAKLLGKIVEVSYQEIMPSGALRFPKFKRFRPDKD